MLSTNLYSPSHKRDFHLFISLIGFIFLFNYHPVGIGTRPFGRNLDGNTFQYFLQRDTLIIREYIKNISLLGSAMD